MMDNLDIYTLSVYSGSFVIVYLLVPPIVSAMFDILYQLVASFSWVRNTAVWKWLTGIAALVAKTVGCSVKAMSVRQVRVSKFTKLELGGRKIINLRQKQLVEALIQRKYVSREMLDDLLGVRNSPDVVWQLRRCNGWNVLTVQRKSLGLQTTPVRQFYTLAALDVEVAKRMLGVTLLFTRPRI